MAILKVKRLIVYTGTRKDIEKQLASSMSDGAHRRGIGGSYIRIITVPTISLTWSSIKEVIKILFVNKKGGEQDATKHLC